MGFQSQVGSQQGIGVEGDFASANPRYSALAGPGGFVAGPQGVRIGYFCWGASPEDQDGTDQVVNSFGAGQPLGFVHRDQQALITAFLGSSSMVIPTGFMVTVFSDGEFLVINNGTTEVTRGMKAYADFATGKVSFAASGSPGSASSTSYTIAAGTSSFTGTIAGDVLTVTGAVTGVIYPGTTISGTNVASGTKIVSQLGGTVGGDGTYAVSIDDQTVAATTISGTYGLLTVGGTIAGVFGVGDTLSGSGVTTGTTITALGTGTGGAGTYIVDPTQTASSGTITAGTTVETKWYAASTGAAGSLIKITPVRQGF